MEVWLLVQRARGLAPGSLHGMAADIKVPGMTPEDLIKHAFEVGFLGLGLYSTFCHLDIRSRYAWWKG